jgi:putative transposase
MATARWCEIDSSPPRRKIMGIPVAGDLPSPADQPPLCVPLPTMVGRRRMSTVQHRKHTPEQIVRKLREADKLLADGADVATVAKHLEISEQTFYRWRNRFGGMKADDATELKGLYAINLGRRPRNLVTC